MEEHNDTILKAFLANAVKFPDKILFTQPMGGVKGEVGELEGKKIQEWTFQEALEETKKMAGYIESKGLERGSKIAICSKNCAWWVMADLAIWMTGHVTVPVYPTLTHETLAYTLEHSEAKLLFIGKLDEEPWKEMKEGIPEDLDKVSFPLCPKGDWGEKWDDAIAQAEPIKEIAKRDPEELATIIYTSGSTGKPKGVMISFANMTIPTQGVIKLFKINSKDRYLSYLPLSHGMARWLDECVCIYAAVHIFYAESLDTFVTDLNRAHPTIFLSVPRLWTKFQRGVYEKMSPKLLNALMCIPVLGYFVKRKILKGLGLDAVRMAGSGSSPIPHELLAWYRRLGLNLLEGYGMTENFNYSHISRPGRCRDGYVGEPYDDVKHRIAEDGEIQVMSPGIMMGYYKNDEETKKTLCDDGWLRTGDRGEIDNKNRLKITGRTKDIFKTSKGKYVAPAPIETKLNVSDSVELSCVTGTGQQPIAIIQLSEQARKTAEDEKSRSPITSEIEALMDDINKTVDSHEALDKCIIVSDHWLPENGFLTPTQKIKRKAIEDAYKNKFDEWYSSKQKVIWYGW